MRRPNLGRASVYLAAGAFTAATAILVPQLITGDAVVTVPPGWAPGMAVAVPALTSSEPITAANARFLPPCLEEDGGNAPCFWNAGKAGNGRGFSFWVGPDFCTKYVDPKYNAQRGERPPCQNPYAE